MNAPMPLGHFLLVLAICCAWGGNFLASAAALRHFPPFVFTALRLCVVLLCLLPLLRRVPRGQWPRLIAVCLLNGALHFGFNFMALRQAGDISSVAIALQSYVPMSALLAVWLLGERIGWRAGTGIGIAFGGVLVLGFDPLVLDAPAALVTTLVAAFALAPLLFEAEQPGTEILHPVAVVIFSGLVSSTLLDTFVTPALFWLFGRKAAERLLAEGGDEAL